MTERIMVDDFRAGDRVTHRTLGRGVVDAVDQIAPPRDRCVRVTYERRYRDGQNIVAAYDQQWLDTYPGWLVRAVRPVHD